MKNYFIVRVEDTERTHNVNMHSHHVFATSPQEAKKQMLKDRPEFKGRRITGIIKVYESSLIN